MFAQEPPVNPETSIVKSASHITVDSAQIQQHLELLGFQPDEDVFFRAFYHSSDPRKSSGGASNAQFKAKELDKITNQCNQWQRQGKGVYIVANGQGHTKSKVTQGRVLFYEHDKISLEESENYWQKLNLPEPTFQVYTGGKSIHSYWVLDFPIPIGEWEETIKDLIIVANADKANKDPSRVLRLAGCYHVESAEKVNDQAELINVSNSTYNADILKTYITDACTRDVDIWGWMPDMMRYLEGYTEGARDGWVVAKCPAHDGTSKDSLHANTETGKYICHSGCEPTDVFWAVFNESKKNENPKLENLTKNADLMRLVAASVNEKIANEQDGNAQSKSANKSKTNVYNFPVAKDGLEPIETVIRDYLENENPTRREKILYIKSLVEDYGYRSDKVVHELFQAIQREIDQAEQLDELAKKVDELLKIDQQCLDIDALFPGKLGVEMRKAAALLDVPVEPIITLLLPILGSLVNPKIGVKAWDDFVEHMNFWGYLNAKTGEGKSPLLKLVAKPLKRLQTKEYEEYKARKKHHDDAYSLAKLQKDVEVIAELEKEENQVQPMRDLFFDSVTIEAIALHLSKHGQNALIICDELIGFFNSLGQYKGGKGNDAQKILELYNGSGIKQNTKTAGNAYNEIGGMSIVGGLHPDEVAKMLQGEDANGMVARACICTYEKLNSEEVDHTITNNFSEMLVNLYQNILAFDATVAEDKTEITLDINAFKIFEKFCKWNSTNIKKADSKPLEAALNKNAGKVLRFAGLLHILDCVNKGEELGQIDGATITKAIGLAHYYSQQFVSLYASHGHGSANAPDIKKALYYIAEQENNEASINQIRKYCLQRRDPNHFAEVCEQLVALGHCTKHKKGKSWVLRLVEAKEKK